MQHILAIACPLVAIIASGIALGVGIAAWRELRAMERRVGEIDRMYGAIKKKPGARPG